MIKLSFRLIVWAALALVFLGVVRLAQCDAGRATRASTGATPSSHATTPAPSVAKPTTPESANHRGDASSTPTTTTPSPTSTATPPSNVTPPAPVPVVGAIPKPTHAQGKNGRPISGRDVQDPLDDGSNGGLGSLPPGPGAEYEGLGVQCLSRTTRRKLSGVSVRWALAEDLDAWRAQNPGRNVEDADPETVLSANKKPSISGEGGVALTPSAPGRILVDARLGNLYGFAWVDRNKTPRTTIELVEDRDLFFRALGADGAPMSGVPVVVRDSSCAEIWRGTTQGSEGVARFRHAGFVIERDASPGACVALVDGVLPSARTYVIPRLTLPLGDVDLATVPSGRVVVHVTDDTGVRVKEPVLVTLADDGADVCGRATTRVAREGEAVFEHVEPNAALRVRVDGLDVYEGVDASAKGPDGPNATRTLDVAFRRRLPIVRVHLVEAPAIPIENANGAAWLEVETGGVVSSIPSRQPLATDTQGNVRLVFDDPPAGARATALFVALRNRFGDWYSSARIPLAEGVMARETDLGRREVTEMPTLAAGYVLDDRGSPVPDAVVEVSGGPASGSAEEFRADIRWFVTADGMGRFRLRGFVDGERIALSASSPEHVRPERVVVPRGEKKVTLKLPRTSTLTGKLWLPNRMPLEDVRLWVESDGETIPGSIDATGSFRVGDIRPGTAGLFVTVAGLEAPVYSVPGLTAKPGVEITEATAVSIDLRKRLAFVNVYVLDAQDRPVAKGSARVIETDDEGSHERTVPLASGFASFYTTYASVDVEVTAPGFETVKLTGIDRDTEVHLVPNGK